VRFPQEDASGREAAYRIARHGLVGAHLLPILNGLIDLVAERMRLNAVLAVLLPLFACFAVAGWMDTSHRQRIVAEARFSTSASALHPHRYATVRKVRGGRSPAGGGMFVSASDAAVHRFWKFLRATSGWLFTASLAVIVTAWCRRHQRALAADAFGADTDEYHEFLERRSPEACHGRELDNDWLLSGPPGPGERDLRTGGQRPVFGRRAGPADEPR
jgi:hypothetical protein